MRRWRGAKDFLFDSVVSITNLVEQTNLRAAEQTVNLLDKIEPLDDLQPATHLVRDVHALSTKAVCTGIRAITGGVEMASDALLAPVLERDTEERAAPIRTDAQMTLPWLIEQAEGSLNGFLGDFLAKQDNPLATKMSLRRDDGRPLPLDELAQREDPSPKLCLFVHGLATTEWCWSMFADEHLGAPDRNFGTMLREDLGIHPLYLRYNSGRHVSENGRELAELLEQLVEHYPVDIEQLSLVGHSMGGLVVRSAAQYAHEHQMSWLQHLEHIFCIGSPHLGAPLEKAANLLSTTFRVADVPATFVLRRILDARSEGVKDLRFGYTHDDEWAGEDADAFLDDKRLDLELLPGVTYTILAATIARDDAHPAGQLLGDLLVRKPSATGAHHDTEHSIPFEDATMIPGTNHFQLVSHPAVYPILRDTLA